jgi:hypothetical protein
MPSYFSTEDIALQAMLDCAALRELLNGAHDLLTVSLRHGFGKLMKETQEAGIFDPAVLDHACTLQQRLIRDVDSCGGAPMPARSDEGDLLWLGGTDESRALSEVERCLDQFIIKASYVSHALEAEVALERRRAQLGAF